MDGTKFSLHLSWQQWTCRDVVGRCQCPSLMDQNIWRARRKWAQTTKLSCWTWRTTSLFKSGLKYICFYCLEFAGSSLLMVFFLKWQNLLECIWALYWSHTDLGCRGGSDLTSGTELLTLTKIRDLWEHSLLFASTLSVLERASWLNCNIFLLANTFLQREGGGKALQMCIFGVMWRVWWETSFSRLFI